MPVPAGPGAPPVVTGPIYYDPALSRVRLAVPGLHDLAPVTVQRSTDQVRWTTVRGGEAVPVVSGTARLDDYEFAADVPNWYRVLGPSAADAFGRLVSGGWGSAELGGAWTTTGGSASDYTVGSGVGLQSHGTIGVLRYSLLDVGSADFDLSVDVSLPITSAASAPVTLWLVGRLSDLSNYYVARLSLSTAGVMTLEIARRVAGTISTVASAVTVGVNTSGDWWRLTFAGAGGTLSASARNLTVGGPLTWLTGTDSNLTGGTQVGVASRLELGNSNTLPVVALWDNLVAVGPQQDLYQASIVPNIGVVWLKSIARPFLNRPVTVVDYSDVERPARAGVFEVVGRSFPVSVNDVRGSRRWTMDVLTQTVGEADELDLVLASGDPMFIHVPAGVDVPGGHVVIGDAARRRTSRLGPRRVFELPCTEVAAPGPDVIGSTVTCQTVLNTYATCAAVLAAHATCLSLMELIGDPEDVIVP